MAKLQNGQKGPFTLVRVNGRRSKLQLTRYSEEAAQTICHHVTQLESSLAAESPIPAETQAWLSKIDESLHVRLAKLGLCRSYQDITVEAAIGDHLALTRRDMTEQTVRTHRGHLKGFRKFLGKDMPMSEVTEEHARAFRDWLDNGPLTQSTKSRRIGQVKSLFQDAVEAGQIRDNPFAWFCGKKCQYEEKPYIDADRVEHLIQYAPTPEWRMVLALARYGGLRIPSEIRKLKWSDIDWDRKRFLVHSPKTKNHPKGDKRYVPLFREVAGHLGPYRQDSGHVLGYLAKYKGFGTPLVNWSRNLDIEIWPSPFGSQRASRITDLLKKGKQVQDVAKWMGNSPKIIWQHYALANDDAAADLI